jgi:hypothetical protein
MKEEMMEEYIILSKRNGRESIEEQTPLKEWIKVDNQSERMSKEK